MSFGCFRQLSVFTVGWNYHLPGKPGWWSV